ncbi:hypothetical protein [Nocardioides rubriscoriae]|uniref:hypothetical protein n=1 Tax=Nocardioides rubriscoriae TaxID=642762 RepID=UPI0011E06166|nr:hypothetical protein [Nocardioides rubriscoriae]
MFESNDHDAVPATTPFVVPDLSGLERLWAAIVTLEPVAASADTLRDFLAAHRLIWDMPSLCEVFPEITEHLEARYHLAHDGESVTVTYLAPSADGAPETFDIDDVRHVVDILLSREYREALWRESVVPAFDRLVG